MVAYYTVKIVSKLLRVFPFPVALFLGECAGRLLYLNRKKRLIAFGNIKRAFPSKTHSEICRIIKKSMMNFGMSIVEGLLVCRCLQKEHITVKGLDETAEGHLFVGIHAGSWELYNAFFTSRQRNKLAVLVKKQKNRSFDTFLNEERRKNNISVCFSLRELVLYVRKGFWIGLVIDHGAEENALYIEFFGVPVPTPQGAVFLARKFNRAIYPSFGYRQGRYQHAVEVGKPIVCGQRTSQDILRELNLFYERCLTRHPEQYMWWFKRFKRRRSARILVLSDGKTGHLKQSKALVEILKGSDYEIQSEVVEIASFNSLRRFLLDVCAVLTTKGSLRSIRYLRWFLPARVYNALRGRFADVVVSTGSMMAPVNIIFSRAIAAKSVLILKPNAAINRCDIAFIPEHDRVKGDTVVPIKGALTYPCAMDRDRTLIEEAFSLGEGKRVALFIGGALNNADVFRKNTRIFLKQLKRFVSEKGYRLMVTTSRRTSPAVEECIAEELKNFPLLDVTVFVNRHNYPFILGGFLSLAEIVFVTSDSISMISESLSVGRTTVCVGLEDILDTHHQNFYASLEGTVTFLKPPFAIKELCVAKHRFFEDNKRSVLEAFERII